jgi:hypothetical protein
MIELLTTEQITARLSLSPATQHVMEQIFFEKQMEAFPEASHLNERERQYCQANLLTSGIFVIRETPEGWWRESIDFKGDITKQIDKLRLDPTIACGWITTPRFTGPGGWYDPTI